MQELWVKICGITRVDDAKAINAISDGVNAIGLNFYPSSKRFVATDNAVELRACFGSGIDVFGVFVNEDHRKIEQIARVVQLTGIQFHGDETDEHIIDFATRHPHLKIVRAYRIRDSDFSVAQESAVQLAAAIPNLFGILVDAFDPTEYGGTGHQLSAERVRNWIETQPNLPPVILAGGLNPSNVTAAIRTATPMGVDTASGVEVNAGRKDLSQCQAFCAAVRSARLQN